MALPETLIAEPPPLRRDAGGVLRVGGTRVRLDTVIAAFDSGASAGEILLQYPSLQLGDIYAVMAYCLRHPDEVNAYLEERRIAVEEARREDERRFPSQDIRERLLARRGAKP